MNDKSIDHPFLPFFPDNTKLRKHWWHWGVMFFCYYVAISCYYTLLWAVVYFLDTTRFPSPINQGIAVFTFFILKPFGFLMQLPTSVVGKILPKVFESSLMGNFFQPLPMLIVAILAVTPSLIYKLSIIYVYNKKKTRI